MCYWYKETDGSNPRNQRPAEPAPHAREVEVIMNTISPILTLTYDPNPFAAAVSTALPVKVKIEVGEGEPIESALRRFKRQVNQSGHLMELRHKRYFENSQERKKRKIVQARFRVRMERMNARRMRKQRT